MDEPTTVTTALPTELVGLEDLVRRRAAALLPPGSASPTQVRRAETTAIRLLMRDIEFYKQGGA